jgi:hypothetical protein
MPAMTSYRSQLEAQLSGLEATAGMDRFLLTIRSIAAAGSVPSGYSGFEGFGGNPVFDKLIIEELMPFR